MKKEINQPKKYKSKWNLALYSVQAAQGKKMDGALPQ
jgi:hypothetical protein